MGEQINDFLDGPKVAGVNDQEDADIAQLTQDIADAKAAYLQSLADALSNLNSQEDTAESNINTLAAVVAARRCEYGFGALSPNQNGRINFKTAFDTIPEVTIGITGFTAHLDIFKYGSYNVDSLRLDKSADNVSTTG